MAWGWSHTADAEENAFARLHREDAETLGVIYAEWEATGGVMPPDMDPPFDEARYATALDEAKSLPTDVLARSIWDRASAPEARTCDNGGARLWVCPWGCHSESVEPPEEEEGGEG